VRAAAIVAGQGRVAVFTVVQLELVEIPHHRHPDELVRVLRRRRRQAFLWTSGFVLPTIR
jgi:hypothetical protein